MNVKNIDKNKLDDEIEKRIRLLKGSNSRLSYGDKRTLVINNMKKEYEEKNQKELSESLNTTECLDLQNNTIILFDIAQIIKAREAALEQKISLINEINLTYEEKRLKVLNDLNSSETFECVEGKDPINDKPNVILYEPSINVTDSAQSAHFDSTMDSSKFTESAEEPLNLETSMEIKLKTNFWIKNEYYDKSQLFGKAHKKGIKEIKLIEDDKKSDKRNEYTAYAYNDDLNTYNFAISQKILSTYKMNDIITKGKADDNNFNSEYGLYFCGKNIKKDICCKPGQMICKNCMEKNKEFYSLSNHKSALININGRVACKFKDGLYHCLGKFKIVQTIKNCLNDEFCCKACEELNKNIQYYKQK